MPESTGPTVLIGHCFCKVLRFETHSIRITICAMPKESIAKAKERDFSVQAAQLVELTIGEHLDGTPLPDPNSGKNPHAVALGRMGAQKGGIARAKRLSEKRRSEIARRAATARWAKPRYDKQ